MTAKHPMIPFPVIVRATDGDIEAVNQIVRHYSGFIASRSMRPMKDEYGNTHMVVDETLRRRTKPDCSLKKKASNQRSIKQPNTFRSKESRWAGTP